MHEPGILEVYFEEEDAGDVDGITLGAVNASINGLTYVIQITLATTINNEREAVAGMSGITFGGDDTITIDITGDSTDYNAIIFIQTEGNTIATAEFTN